jgi:Fe-S cluster assembly ATPase SufC
MMEENQDIDLSSNDEIEINAKRREERYSTNAHAGMTEDELLLKNISLSGGQIHGKEFIDVIPNGKYTLAIIPEKESNIDKFEIDIISKWVKIKRNGTESGFIIVLPPGSKMVEEYIEYLKTKQNTGND